MRRESACAIVMTLRRPRHTCILQTRYRLVYTHAVRSPHHLFLMLLMFLPHHGCCCLELGRHLLAKAGLVSSAARGAGAWPWQLGAGHQNGAMWSMLGDGTVSWVSCTSAPCSVQNRACFLTSPCAGVIAGSRPCSPIAFGSGRSWEKRCSTGARLTTALSTSMCSGISTESPM